MNEVASIRSVLHAALIIICFGFSLPAQTTKPGAVDVSFNPGKGPDGTVRSVLIRRNGTILIGGNITKVNGVAREYLASLHPNGRLDPSFVVPARGIRVRNVYDAVEMPDGKLVVVGNFYKLGTNGYRNITGLSATGSVNTNFVPDDAGLHSYHRIVRLPDNRLLVGGNGANFFHIRRLLHNGRTDSDFQVYRINNQRTGGINAIVAQPDGRIIVGGALTMVGSRTARHLARFHAHGGHDVTLDVGRGPNESITSLVLQPDGKIIAAGSFGLVKGEPHRGIVRFDRHGSIDPTFESGFGFHGSVTILTQQPDGKILAGGTFTHYDAVARKNLVRLNADGSLDPSFDPKGGPDGHVYDIAVQPDGRIVIGGEFTHVNGIYRPRVARLHGDGQ